ncbi:sugar (pentulose or hexulose) kinase, partial [Flavobacterium sp. 7A]|nr:sugar (pentulose or hexulose) kinase [Flavobacterium sp. 7A]MCW2120070.1 sugar (pentulose or hexulose) kinase [Flavobacterium sp. 7A]
MYYIGFDIGSSSVKAAIVEIATGKSIGVVQE